MSGEGELEDYVRSIISDVVRRGEEALRDYSRRFDSYDGEFLVSEEEFDEAESIPEEDKEVLRRVVDRVWRHHEHQAPDNLIKISEGSLYGLIVRPIGRIGIYVPRGLVSTLIMVGVPARIAGVEEIVVCTPPIEGKVPLHMLYVAKLLGIREVYKLGGVQAIAAMAYGVGMRKVDKIFGPGNRFVNEAKRQVFGTVGIDGLAGPSEIAIIADGSADVNYVLADLLSQLEHGRDTKAWLLTTSEDLANACRREGIEVILCDSLDECVRRANEIAPEHLEIITENPLKLLDEVKNAGAIYLGAYTPVPAGDYFLGVNHVLPTGKAAKFSSVLTVMDFVKWISVAMADRDEFLRERKLGIRMAELEGMQAHKKALEVRR